MNTAKKLIIGAGAVLGLAIANVHAHQGPQSMTPEARAAMQEKMRSATPEERQKLAAEHRAGMGNHGTGHGAGMGKHGMGHGAGMGKHGMGHGAGMGKHGMGHGAGMGCGMAAAQGTEEHKH